MGDLCTGFFALFLLLGAAHGLARWAKSRSDPEGHARDEEERRERRGAVFGAGLEAFRKWANGK